MADISMPPSEHSCLLDLLGVVWERRNEALTSGQTHHPQHLRWSGSRVSSFCATAMCARQLVVFIPCGMIAVSTNWIIRDENHTLLLTAV